MRTYLLGGALLALSAASGTADAALSNAIFANSDGSAPGSVMLSLTTASGTSLVNASAAGWYDQTGFHDPTIGNYLAGVCGSSDGCLGDDLARRNFFVFDLSNQHETVLAASLSLYNPSAGTDPGTGLPIAAGYISTAPTLTYTNFDVRTALGDLTGTNAGRTDIYGDLGSGAIFGSALVTPGSNGAFVTIPLDSAAVAAIGRGLGSAFAVGGAITQVPEPVSLSVFAMAAVGVLGARRRRAVG